MQQLCCTSLALHACPVCPTKYAAELTGHAALHSKPSLRQQTLNPTDMCSTDNVLHCLKKQKALTGTHAFPHLKNDEEDTNGGSDLV